jgi:hypothetical protein
LELIKPAFFGLTGACCDKERNVTVLMFLHLGRGYTQMQQMWAVKYNALRLLDVP